LKNATNPESILKFYAAQYALNLAPAEIDVALGYLSSPVAKKQRDIANSFGDPEWLAPTVQEACSRARVRLSAVGMVGEASLDQSCPLKQARQRRVWLSADPFEQFRVRRQP
jgi:hypothetical protein